MAVIDLTSIVDQRLADITKLNPSMKADEFYFEGETGLWCLITIQGSGGRVIEYDFLESEESWKRKSAITEYIQASMEQVKVLVIAPDLSLADLLLLVRDNDAEGVLVSDYSAMGLIPMPLAY